MQDGRSCLVYSKNKYLGRGCQKDLLESCKYNFIACDLKITDGCLNAGKRTCGFIRVRHFFNCSLMQIYAYILVYWRHLLGRRHWRSAEKRVGSDQLLSKGVRQQASGRLPSPLQHVFERHRSGTRSAASVRLREQRVRLRRHVRLRQCVDHVAQGRRRCAGCGTSRRVPRQSRRDQEKLRERTRAFERRVRRTAQIESNNNNNNNKIIDT